MKMALTRNLQDRLDRVFESLDDLGARIYRDYQNGNKADARMAFNAIPPERRGYLAFTIIGLHMTCGDNHRVIDLENFFKSVTQ